MGKNLSETFIPIIIGIREFLVLKLGKLYSPNLYAK
jgi:hypothetical protein